MEESKITYLENLGANGNYKAEQTKFWYIIL